MRVKETHAELSLVPPRRMGRLLASARSRKGLSIPAAAFATYGRFDALDLRVVEAGDIAVSDEDVRMFCDIYGLDLQGLMPSRMELVIDRSEGWIRTGATQRTVSRNADDQGILIRYLALVYELRGIKPGRLIVPRARDLQVLGALFRRNPDEVRLRLESLMREAREEIAAVSARLHERVAVPRIGVMVGFTGIGALLLEERADDVIDLDLPRIPEIGALSA